MRPLWPLWFCSVGVWLKARDTVAESPCKCGSIAGIYRETQTCKQHKIYITYTKNTGSAFVKPVPYSFGSVKDFSQNGLQALA